MDDKVVKFVLREIRRSSRKFPPRNLAKTAQRVGPATFECEACKLWIYEGKRTLAETKLLPEYAKMWKSKKASQTIVAGKIHMDHKNPVIPPKGFKSGLQYDWNEIIANMFVEKSGWSVLCKPCHQLKTNAENVTRRATKNANRKKKTKKRQAKTSRTKRSKVHKGNRASARNA